MAGTMRRARCVLLMGFVLATGSVVLAAAEPLLPVHWDDAYQRWRDIATNLYAADKEATYQYESATVTVAFDATGPTFQGRITGSGLKPNFAYQLKLNGKPTYAWGTGGDDWGNEQLGYAGRWWLTVYDAGGAWLWARNSSDQEYEQWQALGFVDPETGDRYVFEGYLLFDYVVTNAEGNVDKALALDSSLHVLWKTTQRSPGSNDTTPTSHTVVTQRESEWYDKRRTTTVSLYGEWEPGRPLPGELALPLGDYNVRLFFTEESFHETAPDSGSWATVMTCDGIAFTVDDTAPPPPPAISLDSVEAADTQVGGQCDITASVLNTGGSDGTVTLQCEVIGTKRSQTLQQKSVTVEPGGAATVTWDDPLSRAIRPGTYIARVTILETGESLDSNSFAVQ